MLELFVGCRTDVPNRPSYFYHLEMTADSYPSIDSREELKDFLQPNVAEIIDEVVFLVDASSGSLIWNVKEEDQNIVTSK